GMTRRRSFIWTAFVRSKVHACNHGPVTQLARVADSYNPKVVGSSPTRPTREREMETWHAANLHRLASASRKRAVSIGLSVHPLTLGLVSVGRPPFLTRRRKPTVM